MKSIVISFLFILVPFCFLNAQSEELDATVREMLEILTVSEVETLIEHSGARTNTEFTLNTKVEGFSAYTNYVLVVIVDGCQDCTLVVEYVSPDYEVVDLEPTTINEGNLLIGSVIFKETEYTEGYIQMFVDTYSYYYTYYFLYTAE